jgi:hypothetical protein
MFTCIDILREENILVTITEHYEGERDKTYADIVQNYVNKATTHNLLFLSANSYQTVWKELQRGFLSNYNYLSTHYNKTTEAFFFFL